MEIVIWEKDRKKREEVKKAEMDFTSDKDKGYW